MKSNLSSAPKWHYIIITLLIFGLIVQFISRPGTILIPLVIIGLVYYLYKRPPAWLQRFAFRGNTFNTRNPKPKKKKYRFRVINGKKN